MKLPPNAVTNNELVSLNSVSQSSKTKQISSSPPSTVRSVGLTLWGSILPHDALDPTLVLHAILLEKIVRLSLGRRFGVGVVE